MPLILYVDDEAHALKYMQRALDGECELISCIEIDDALNVIKTRGDQLDVVIADERMPDMNGRDLLRVAQRRNDKATRILTTAFAEVSCLAECLNEGLLDRVILKPWDPDALVGEVLSTYKAKTKLNKIGLCDEYFSNVDASVRRLELISSALLAHSRFSDVDTDHLGLVSLLEKEISGVNEIVSSAFKNSALLPKPDWREICDLEVCLEKALEKLRQTDQGAVHLNVDLAAGPTLIKSSESLVELVLVELLAYAVSVAEDPIKGAVSVSMRQSGGTAIMTVKGSGMVDLLGVARGILIGRGTTGNLGLTVISWIARHVGGEFHVKFTEVSNIEMTLEFPLLLN
ncbi:MAG: response regulator [Filomicrobium sp.]